MRLSRSQTGNDEGEVRAGFTLLEVLLTSLLASVVLIALWSLSDIYLRMFATGRKKIEETQIVRGVTAQLAKDLSQIVMNSDDDGDFSSGPLIPLFNGGSESSFDPAMSGAAAPDSSARGRFGGTRPGALQENSADRDFNGQRSMSRNSGSPDAGRDAGPGAARSRGAGGLGGESPGVPGRPQGRNELAGSSLSGQRNSANGPVLPSRDSFRNSNSSPSNAVGGDPSAEQLIPKFGLLGTSRSLRLMILQADPAQTQGPTDLTEVLPLPGQPRASFATELRTIQYSFALPTEAATTNEAQHPPGLVRREWSWETWAGIHALSSSVPSAEVSDLPDWNAEDALAFERGRDVHHLPQVIGIEFRYFDGLDWDFEWDSEERGSLPVLVEVLLKVSTTGDSAGTTSMAAEDAESEDGASSTEEGVSSSWSSAPGAVYRQLIHLPFAATPADQADPSGNHLGQPMVPEVAGTPAVSPPARSRP
ncbi:hypothetical protein [Schlesneria sp. DSM 10557]|uniref:hypothetical protein n=1 Tax=Schlesneria sp. DSM 10557 TaxID=3044399 RepID=UPI0035A183CB